MKIIVNDANILIDLLSVNLLDIFLELDYEFHTNDFILNEITNQTQRHQLEKVIEANKLILNETKSKDYVEILKLKTKGLSFEDCSIWFYAKKIGGILLTGDNLLRKTAEKDMIPVKGILFVFDELVDSGKLDKKAARFKLFQLTKLNPRLPVLEINKRLVHWEK
ncbi:MAG: hypothetical protein JXL97_10630 [Bacteroidales bacterium]|nr:hypothetical protein [Bacteroidales bacterium]